MIMLCVVWVVPINRMSVSSKIEDDFARYGRTIQRSVNVFSGSRDSINAKQMSSRCGKPIARSYSGSYNKSTSVSVPR
jgi:hypothetical protein